MFHNLVRKNKIIYQSARFLYSRYSYLRNKKILDRNKELKNKYKGKRCFVVGNGSSINQQDLTKLKNEYTFVCNHFYFHKDLNIIKPIFYSLIEPIILNDLFRKNLFPKMIEEINSYGFSNPSAVFFFNIQYEKYIKSNNLFPKNKIYYFLSGGSISDRMNRDMSKPNPSLTASIFFLLAIASYLGFNPIYILGFDYDYIVKKDEKHFYQIEPILQKSKLSFQELSKCFYEDLKRLEIFNRFFQKNDIQVFNTGIGSMIETFSRAEYNSLF